MTLPDALREAIRHMKTNKAAVTIARAVGGDHAYQVRIAPDATVARGYRVSGRRWIVETRPGTECECWAPWTNLLGFGVDQVVADDWKLVVVEEL